MQEKGISSFKDLIIWQKSADLAVLVYKITRSFPSEEMYGLTSQMRRASISISSNIAEGSIRGSKKEFQRFLRIALGSLTELRAQIEITKRLSFGENLNYNEIDSLIVEISKMAHALMRKL
jgi:four helix bundle protein